MLNSPIPLLTPISSPLDPLTFIYESVASKRPFPLRFEPIVVLSKNKPVLLLVFTIAVIPSPTIKSAEKLFIDAITNILSNPNFFFILLPPYSFIFVLHLKI